MQSVSAQCRELRKHFLDKFEVHSIIRHTRYGEFILQKKDLLGAKPYYIMGQTLSMAHWYIDNLKQIPNATLVFETLEQLKEYKKEQRERRKQHAENT